LNRSYKSLILLNNFTKLTSMSNIVEPNRSYKVEQSTQLATTYALANWGLP
jgi:hypothetical protein